MRTMSIYIAVLGCTILVSCMAELDPTGFQFSNKSTDELSHPVKIGYISNNSEKYNGELVAVEGTYLGWSGPITGVPPTRSDWGIKDETGAIFVTGSHAGLDPTKDVGVGLIVSGIVHLLKGTPYLEGRNVTLIGTST
jgi:hypothetical protein